MLAKTHYHCAVIGDWHLAFITAACLSELGHRTALINPLSPGRPPWPAFPELALSEPELPEIIDRSRREGRLVHVNGIGGEWSADFVWLAIDTPVDDRDEADVSVLLEAAERVARTGACAGVFVVTSQVPLGFCAKLESELGLSVACVPENLRLGRGVDTFLRSDRVVIGARTPETAEHVRDSLAGVRGDTLLCDLATAEMIKHATNAFLATSISFANELARIGEKHHVDNQLVAAALKLDKRIGNRAYVAPGLGFAGGTLPRDLRVLQKLGKASAVPTPLVDAVLEVNDSTAAAIFDSVAAHVGDLRGKDVLVLGYSYKGDTDTLRRSMSIDLAKRLRESGARVRGYDPLMNGRDLTALAGIIDHRSDWAAVGPAPDAAVVMTPRKEFASLAWNTLVVDRARRPVPLVVDARAIVDGDAVLRAGFAFKSLWQPALLP